MKPGKLFLFLIAIVVILIGFSEATLTADAQIPTLDIFVANTAEECSGKPQCFYNDAPDTPQSVALNKALKLCTGQLSWWRAYTYFGCL